MKYQPPAPSPAILNRVAAISGAIGRFRARRSGRSLAAAAHQPYPHRSRFIGHQWQHFKRGAERRVLEGKRVIAPLREVQEVKKALAAYERFCTWKPEAEKELLEAHLDSDVRPGRRDCIGMAAWRHGGKPSNSHGSARRPGATSDRRFVPLAGHHRRPSAYRQPGLSLRVRTPSPTATAAWGGCGRVIRAIRNNQRIS